MQQLNLKAMALRSEMRDVLATPNPSDGQELRRLLGRLDAALERSKFGVRSAKSKGVAFEVLGLHMQLRRQRIELMKKLRAER